MLLSPIGSPSKTFAQLNLLPLKPDVEIELRLPVEIIFYIVELAVTTSKRCSLSLCLVSSWVREAVIPIMYTSIVLQGNMSTPFINTRLFSSPRQPSSPLRHIRHLWLDVGPDRCPRSLDECLQITHLALHLDAHESICNTHSWNCSPTCRSFTVLGQSHPNRWAPITQSNRGLAFLRGITHLRLLNMCLSHYIPLEYTPNLTHLCIPFFDLRGTEFDGLDYILSQPKLEMVVLTLNPRYWRFEELALKEWAYLAMAKDDRLFVVASTRLDATRDWDDPRRDWENEASGGLSIWEKAIQVRKKFIARLSKTYES